MAKDRKEEPEAQELPIEPKKSGKMKWIIVILVSVVVICAGAGTGLYFFMNKDHKKAEVAKPAVVAIWPMEAFIVNIADTNGSRYLKLVVQLEVSDQTVVPELEQLKPKLRDTILDLLSPKTYQDLMELSGKQRLREDIAGRVNNILTKGKVTKVYFTDFVIQ